MFAITKMPEVDAYNYGTLVTESRGGTFSSVKNMLMNNNIVIGLNVTFSVYKKHL